MHRILTILTFLFLGISSAVAQNYDRGYETIPSSPFVSKGTWVVGGSLSYSQHINEGHSIMLVEDINSQGYNISVNPRTIYMFKDNMGVGLKFSYDRNMMDLASANFSVAGVEMSAEDCYQIGHEFSAYALCRAYIPFTNVKRFSLFADLLLGGSYKQGKAFNAGLEYISGTYETATNLKLAVNPGIMAFLTNHLAVECNMGLFGLSYGWKKQIGNQVEVGSTDLASAGFMVNLLSVEIGLSYYFL